MLSHFPQENIIFLPGSLSVQQDIPEDLLFRQGQELFHSGVILPLLQLRLFDLVFYFFYYRKHPLLIARFEDIVLDPHLHCLARVFVFSVPGQYDHLDIGELLFQLPDQPDAVHNRHLDIRHHDVRVSFQHLFIPVLSVPGSARDLNAISIPVNEFRHALALYLFIVYNQKLIHTLIPLPSVLGRGCGSQSPSPLRCQW